MPIPTPFHARTSALCESAEWRNWSGYLAAAVYAPSHEREYYAIRNAAALIDVSPLFKYEIEGPDAVRLVDRIMTRNIGACAVGRVMYTVWCDDDGYVIDDGTVSRLAEDRLRITSADPSLRWFQDCGIGMNVEVTDVSTRLAALSLQGPLSREILKTLVRDTDLDALRYFRLAEVEIGGIPLTLTRTGYTGDLGYELWVDSARAVPLWDVLMEAGRGYGILPTGIVPMDIARIEAGLLLIEVDYFSSNKALIQAQKSRPDEIGLGWAVSWKKGDFVGRSALQARRGHRSPLDWRFVGFEIDWPDLEQRFDAVGLAPQVAGRASRAPVPVYCDGRQIGQATSSVFSPILKKYLALGTIERAYADLGTTVEIELTVEYSRRRVKATIVKLPFFDPPRKKA